MMLGALTELEVDDSACVSPNSRSRKRMCMPARSDPLDSEWMDMKGIGGDFDGMTPRQLAEEHGYDVLDLTVLGELSESFFFSYPILYIKTTKHELVMGAFKYCNDENVSKLNDLSHYYDESICKTVPVKMNGEAKALGWKSWEVILQSI